MNTMETLALLQQQFGSAILSARPDALDPFAVVAPTELVTICTFLRDDPRTQFDLLNNLTGVDYLEPNAKKVAKAGFEPHLEVVYHLSSFQVPGRRITLKVLLPRWANETPGELPEVPTVSGVWPTADWHERECYDLLGIRFSKHPDLRRILMSDDWIGHPLRKDYEFPLEYQDIRCR
jgi:NADH-quinone oxidoreductase subunit C